MIGELGLLLVLCHKDLTESMVGTDEKRVKIHVGRGLEDDI